MTTKAIIYLLRKTSLTRAEIGKLSPLQFNEILKEVYSQESQEEYQRNHAIASILAAIYNTIPRKGGKAFKASDFLKSEPPSRKLPDPIEELADRHGIKLPVKELKERR